MGETNERKLTHFDCKKRKTLGVIIGPALMWDYQFVMMINNMRKATRKLKNTVVMVSTASTRCNMYLRKKVCFRSEALSLNQKQEDILKKTCKPVILKKMVLSEKFPR